MSDYYNEPSGYTTTTGSRKIIIVNAHAFEDIWKLIRKLPYTFTDVKIYHHTGGTTAHLIYEP